MKVGIVTFVDYRNYGNRLQNYALQTILEEVYDADVETIMHDKYCDYRYTDDYFKKLPMHIAKMIFWRVHDFFRNDNRSLGYIWTSSELDKERIKANIEFSDKYIHESSFIIHEGNFQKEKVKKYDLVFTGSDQVWNPTMGAATEIYFLQFIEKGKRASFAASIGISDIPEKYMKQWKKYLNEMDYVSVREDTAKRIVEKTSSKEAEHLLDPTMLVNEQIWYELCKSRTTKLPDKYITTYILGDLSNEDIAALQNLADKNNAEIVKLNDKKYPEEYKFDVIDFLNAIKNAEIVITDSFHACVFSIIFKKNFYVLRRKGEYDNIYSRIGDILKKFGLESRAINNMVEIKDAIGGLGIEVDDNVLKEERQKAFNYLRAIIDK